MEHIRAGRREDVVVVGRPLCARFVGSSTRPVEQRADASHQEYPFRAMNMHESDKNLLVNEKREGPGRHVQSSVLLTSQPLKRMRHGRLYPREGVLKPARAPGPVELRRAGLETRGRREKSPTLE